VAELTEQVAHRAAQRGADRRESAYHDEVRRIVDTTFSLIESTGKLNPSLREILAATGLSTQAFYRYFLSKDELLVVVLDDGRRQLEEYLRVRMAQATSPADKLRAWIDGVLLQGEDQRAARRTRPFVLDEGHLAAAFPTEHGASIARLSNLLLPPIADLEAPGQDPRARAQRAMAVYDLTFAALRRTLLGESGVDDVALVVGFSLAVIGARPEEPDPARPGRRKEE